MKKEKYKNLIIKLIYFIVLLWGIHILSYFVPVNNYGIIPREVSGLPGILFAPFLHHDFSHLAANTAGLFILGLFMITLENKRFFSIAFFIILIGGIGTWFIGRHSIHIGASGLIYGMLGYLIASGFFRRDFKSLLISVVVFVLYNGMIFGVLPVNSSMSWESHLCGFLAGILMASVYGRK